MVYTEISLQQYHQLMVPVRHCLWLWCMCRPRSWFLVVHVVKTVLLRAAYIFSLCSDVAIRNFLSLFHFKPTLHSVVCADRDTLAIGEVLGPGDKLYSSNVCYVLHMEPGGNLRAYHNCAPHRDKEIWSSGTDGFAGAYTIFRPNGYLEVMVPWSKDSIWNQDVLNNDALRLTMQTDGKVRKTQTYKNTSTKTSRRITNMAGWQPCKENIYKCFLMYMYGKQHFCRTGQVAKFCLVNVMCTAIQESCILPVGPRRCAAFNHQREL